jgi:hypothetical protein
MSPPADPIPEIIGILFEAHRDAERADALAAAILDAQAAALGWWGPHPKGDSPAAWEIDPDARRRVADRLAERAKFSREHLERRLLRYQRWDAIRAQARRAAGAAGWGALLEEARTLLDRLERWAVDDLGGEAGPDAGWDALTAVWWDLRERLRDLAGAAPPPPPDPNDLPALMSVRDIARMAGVGPKALGIALRRFLADHPDCRERVNGLRRRDEPAYAYRVRDVWAPVVMPMMARRDREQSFPVKKSSGKSR